MANSLDPDQAQQNVAPDLGPNCLQRLSADNKAALASKELNPNQLVDTTFWLNGYYFLAKSLAKVSFIRLKLFPLG